MCPIPVCARTAICHRILSWPAVDGGLRQHEVGSNSLALCLLAVLVSHKPRSRVSFAILGCPSALSSTPPPRALCDTMHAWPINVCTSLLPLWSAHWHLGEGEGEGTESFDCGSPAWTKQTVLYSYLNERGRRQARTVANGHGDSRLVCLGGRPAPWPRKIEVATKTYAFVTIGCAAGQRCLVSW